MKDDTISRQAALTALNGCTEIYLNNLPPTIYKEDAIKAVKAQPSATDTNVATTQPKYDEWCTDCREYDHERHSCPRWNRVIRQTVEDVKAAQLGCEDAVSREAVIDAIDKWKEACADNGHKETVSDINLIRKDFIELPSVTPKQPGWIPCSEKMPPDYQWYYATCKSLVDNRENWVVEGCYTPWEHFDSTPMIKCGDAEVIAWMPKEFPDPWEGGQDEQN